MPQKRPIVPPVRKTLKPVQEVVLVATTNVPYPVTAEVGTGPCLTGNPNTGFRTPSKNALMSGNNTRVPVTGTVDVNTVTNITDTLRRNATGVMLTFTCQMMKKSGNGW